MGGHGNDDKKNPKKVGPLISALIGNSLNFCLNTF